MIRRNELRDMCANLLTETCHNVRIEPVLHPLSGEQMSMATAAIGDAAHPDIVASGFWGGRFQRTFFDVRVFNPNVRSNLSSQMPALYCCYERTKRNQYEQRTREVEHGTFAPLVWSTSGGAGPSATAFPKRIASKLSEKRDAYELYSGLMGWLRCRFGSALIRSAVMCLRGARSAVGRPMLTDAALAKAEGHYLSA